MAKFNSKFDKKQFSTETVKLGKYIHKSDDLLVLKMEAQNIPYPNSPVLQNKVQVGKIEEVFGAVDDVYVAVKLENKNNVDFAPGATFDGYKDKFIAKERFLPREEVEKRKLKNDKKRSQGSGPRRDGGGVKRQNGRNGDQWKQKNRSFGGPKNSNDKHNERSRNFENSRGGNDRKQYGDNKNGRDKYNKNRSEGTRKDYKR